MPAGNMQMPILFRSWISAANTSYNCTIVEAVRATTAAPMFFKGFEAANSQRFLDTGLRWNNPVQLVVDEARSLYTDRPLSCVLSLGAGTTGVIGLEEPDTFQKSLPTKVLRVLKRIASECEHQSEEMARRLNGSGRPNLYIRLNVDEGLEGVSLEEWNRLDEVETHTRHYLCKAEVNQRVNKLITILQGDVSNHSNSTVCLRLLKSTTVHP